MCILFIAIKQHPDYPLIICANRDEFHDRPTQSAHFWSEPDGLLAGKDLKAGGSWLGINQQGKFAAITNIRDGNPPQENKRSRGDLVINVLDSNNTETNFKESDWLVSSSDEYNPFNLIYGSLENLYCYNSVTKIRTELSAGFHAISNAGMDEIWPKMAKGERQLEAVVNSPKRLNEAALLDILKDTTTANPEQLPETGIPKDWEQLLSSIFIISEKYGTRSSSVLVQKSDMSIKFTEVEYNNKGEQVGLNRFVVN